MDRGPWSVTVTVTVTVTDSVIGAFEGKLRYRWEIQRWAMCSRTSPLALRQGPAGVGPLQRLGQHVVEVTDERNEPFAELVERREAASLEQPPGQDRKPDLHLVEPRAVPRCVDESNPMRGIGQELLAGPLRFQDPSAPLDAKIDFDIAAPGDQLNQALGHVRVELVDDEQPASLGVGVDRRFDMGDEISFCSGRAYRCFPDASVSDIPVRHQAKRAMPDVLKLDALVHPGPRRQRGMLALECLYAGLLVAANDMRPLGLQLWRLQVGVA